MKAMKSPWATMAKPQYNFELKQLEHNGFNPIHQARVEKAYEMKKPKLEKYTAPKGAGNPWMGVK